MSPNSKRDLARKCCRKSMDLFYDLLACVLSLTDVVSDFLVTLTFFKDGHLVFFWLSVVIFLTAQIAYTGLFVLLYCSHKSDTFLVVAFLVVLPFGQFVPAVIWLQSYRWKWLDGLFEFFGLQTNIDIGSSIGDIDPLQEYILEKVRTHGGFFVEAVVESVPQSILQMVAIVAYGEVQPISVFSITVSMVSVASKGLVVSYSIDRKTFCFNLLAFVADVFNIFCTVSWLFFVPQSIFEGSPERRYSIFFLPGQSLSIWTYIWMWKEVVLVVAAAIFGIGLTVVLIMEEYESNHRTTKRVYCLSVLFWFFCILLFLPFMVVVEAFKLIVFPLFILKSLDSAHSSNSHFFRTLFAFLRSNDFEAKVRVTNRFMASRCISVSKGVSDRRTCEARLILGLSDEELTPEAIREISGYTMRGGLFAYTSIIAEEARSTNGRLSYAQKGWIVLLAYIFYFAVPVLIVNGLFSLVYPIISYFTTSAEDMEFLQELLSLIYMATLLVMLMLARSVYSFKKCVIHTMTFGKTQMKKEWVDEIIAEYSDSLVTVFRNEILCEKLPTDIGREILKFCPETHAVVPEWSRVYVTSDVSPGALAAANEAFKKRRLQRRRYEDYMDWDAKEQKEGEGRGTSDSQQHIYGNSYGDHMGQQYDSILCDECSCEHDFCQCVLTDYGSCIKYQAELEMSKISRPANSGDGGGDDIDGKDVEIDVVELVEKKTYLHNDIALL